MESPELSEVRLRLEEAMNMNGWSQVDAAEKSGMTQSTLSRFLAGAGISAENQERLLKFLNEQPEAMVPSSSEMRQAIRLYRYIRRISEEGTTFMLREPNGEERALLILW